jgi:hypothetical protein
MFDFLGRCDWVLIQFQLALCFCILEIVRGCPRDGLEGHQKKRCPSCITARLTTYCFAVNLLIWLICNYRAVIPTREAPETSRYKLFMFLVLAAFFLVLGSKCCRAGDGTLSRQCPRCMRYDFIARTLFFFLVAINFAERGRLPQVFLASIVFVSWNPPREPQRRAAQCGAPPPRREHNHARTPVVRTTNAGVLSFPPREECPSIPFFQERNIQNSFVNSF